MAWIGKCEADKVSTGKYDVPEGDGGTYGLVFDNTFSRQVSKTATFVLMTHPTSATPKSGALPYSQAPAVCSTTSVGRPSPALRAVSEAGTKTVQDAPPITPMLKVPRQLNGTAPDGNFFTGVLYKKRRKRNQGWARRFFSLDFTSSTLSYYQNNHSSTIRGAVPLSLAAIGVNEKNKEFSIDSGAEVWHLRLRNKKDFEAWKRALERASTTTIASPSPATPLHSIRDPSAGIATDPATEREWSRVEELVGRVSGSRDAMRRLAQDTDPKYGPTNGASHTRGTSPSPSLTEVNPFFREEGRSSERLPFWKRKPSHSSVSGSPVGLFRRSVSAQVTPSPSNLATAITPPLPNIQIPRPISPAASHRDTDDVHDRCMALLRDLDNTVSEFSALLAESKTRRTITPLQTTTSRMSLDSISSEDFFDAEEGGQSPSHLLTIQDSVDLDDEKDEFLSDNESETSSDLGERAAAPVLNGVAAEPHSLLFPSRTKISVPKTIPQTERRGTVPPPKQPPPSIIGFLRKNAGKDLSTVTMPVSANEPTSLLQRLAEPLESASLLSKASSLPGPDRVAERLLYVAAFAVSTFASNRVKERAVRKPFNPMLGETYELLAHENALPSSPAFRFVAEKVSHHPVRMAWQADSLSGAWSISQSPQPMQKFWGKSVELNTDGKWRLVLFPTSAGSPALTTIRSGSAEAGERYSWTQAPCFLRNVLAGEKYIEPTQSMTIVNESTGHSAIATFKAAGMFAGRSEDVSITLYAPGSSSPLPLGLTGKWTTSLTRTDTNEVVWTPGSLVRDASKLYGFTTFAAGLNDITAIEKDKIPITDSRLRPDQRALEMGKLDEAEGLKAKLEERQRSRRKVLESHGGQWRPRFFEEIGKADTGDEEVYRLKVGSEGYWECREQGKWDGVQTVFEI